jgi:CBS domain-containing protein
MTQVGDIMVAAVETIDADASVADAARRMRDANVGALPVVDGQGGRLVGIVTDRDLVIRGLAADVDPRALRVRDCATAAPFTVQADWELDDAATLMARHRIGRLPVVDDHHRPVGIVTFRFACAAIVVKRQMLAATTTVAPGAGRAATARGSE